MKLQATMKIHQRMSYHIHKDLRPPPTTESTLLPGCYPHYDLDTCTHTVWTFDILLSSAYKGKPQAPLLLRLHNNKGGRGGQMLGIAFI